MGTPTDLVVGSGRCPACTCCLWERRGQLPHTRAGRGGGGGARLEGELGDLGGGHRHSGEVLLERRRWWRMSERGEGEGLRAVGSAAGRADAARSRFACICCTQGESKTLWLCIAVQTGAAQEPSEAGTTPSCRRADEASLARSRAFAGAAERVWHSESSLHSLSWRGSTQDRCDGEQARLEPPLVLSQRPLSLLQLSRASTIECS